MAVSFGKEYTLLLTNIIGIELFTYYQEFATMIYKKSQTQN